MLKLIFVILWTLTHAFPQDSPYTLTPITNPILREELFKTRLYHETWTTVHFANLEELIDDSHEIGRLLGILIVQCNQHVSCNHKTSLSILKLRFDKINNKLNTLTFITARRKRGLFNLGGSIIKFLFGTMSADDAAKIDRQINRVYDTTSGVAILMKNQTSIMKNSVRQFGQLIQSQRDTLEELNTLAKNSTTQININTFNSNLMELIAQTELNIENFHDTVSILLEAINSGKSGIISPQIVSPKNFMNGLIAIKEKFQFNDLPFPLEIKYYTLYMQISRVRIMLQENKLVYIIDTPIPTGLSYTTYIFTPIPISGWTKYYIYDNIISSPIAIDIDATEYTIIDTTKCIDFPEFKLCELTTPIHKLTEEQSCYAHLIKDRTDNDCTRKYFSLIDSYVLALKNGYSWYILPIEPETITINCKSHVTTIIIRTASILEIHPHCTGSSSRTLYLPKYHGKNSSTVEYKINVSISSIETQFLNSTELKTPVLHGKHLNVQTIQDNAMKLDELVDNLEIITQNHKKDVFISNSFSVLQYLSYSSLGVVLLTILYYCNITKWVFEGLKSMFMKCCAPCNNYFINCISPVAQPAAPTYTQARYTPVTRPILAIEPVSDPEERKLF